MYSGHLLGVHMIKKENACKMYFVASQSDHDQPLIFCQRSTKS